MRRLFCVTFLLIALCATASGEEIRGTVVDAATKAPLVGAVVQVEGTYLAGLVDEQGKFTIRVTDGGIYNLVVQYVGYKSQRVEGVRVGAGAVATLAIELEEESIALDAVRVVAQANRESEQVLIMEQREALVPTVALGAQELSRKGLGDAQAAVAQVAGVAKYEGAKNVFVRGLGDRYNLTTLNGFPMPSEDPEYKNVALDFFASDIIKNVAVHKVFTGANSGDVAGAIVDIASRELTRDYEFGVSAFAGYNTTLAGVDFKKIDGVSYFGVADIRHPRVAEEVYHFENRIEPQAVKAPIDHGFGLSGGYRFNFAGGKHSLALFAVGSHSVDYSFTETLLKDAVPGRGPGGMNLTENQTGQKYSRGAAQIAMGNATLRLFNRHHVTYNFFSIHNSTSFLLNSYGYEAEKFPDPLSPIYSGYTLRQQANDNTLFINQLSTGWELIDGLELTAGVARNLVTGEEPDRREFMLVDANDGTVFFLASNSQNRFFSRLRTTEWIPRATLSYRLPDRFNSGKSRVGAGYIGRLSSTNFAAWSYLLSTYPGRYTLAEALRIDSFYNVENAANYGVYAVRKEFYGIDRATHGAYVDASYQVASMLNVSVGFRYDAVKQRVGYYAAGVGEDTIACRHGFWLPSLNLRFDLHPQHTLRVGASRGYTLPQGKEVAPFIYKNVSFASQGDANLKPSVNYGVDVRWDYHFMRASFVALTGFYKRIENPIARIDQLNSAGILTYANVSPNADVAGCELEARANLLETEAHTLGLGFNAAYIYTNLRVLMANAERRSEMEGASPFTANGDLSYRFRAPKVTFSATLMASYFHDRIHTIGVSGYRDIMEKGRVNLDFIASVKFLGRVGLSFKARNLLNSRIELIRLFDEPLVLESARKGRAFSLGISFDLES